MHRLWKRDYSKTGTPSLYSPGRRHHIHVGIPLPRPLIILPAWTEMPISLHFLTAIRRNSGGRWLNGESRGPSYFIKPYNFHVRCVPWIGAIAPTPAGAGIFFLPIWSVMWLSREPLVLILSRVGNKGKKPWPLWYREVSILTFWASWMGTRTPSTEQWSCPGRTRSSASAMISKSMIINFHKNYVSELFLDCLLICSL